MLRDARMAGMRKPHCGVASFDERLLGAASELGARVGSTFTLRSFPPFVFRISLTQHSLALAAYLSLRCCLYRLCGHSTSPYDVKSKPSLRCAEHLILRDAEKLPFELIG
jgi:hypothetical protein